MLTLKINFKKIKKYIILIKKYFKKQLQKIINEFKRIWLRHVRGFSFTQMSQNKVSFLLVATRIHQSTPPNNIFHLH